MSLKLSNNANRKKMVTNVTNIESTPDQLLSKPEQFPDEDLSSPLNH